MDRERTKIYALNVKRIAVMVALSGCSFAVQETVPRNWTPSAGDPHCTGSGGFGKVDVLESIVAGLGGLGGGVALSADTNVDTIVALGAVVGVGAAIAFGVSAHYGFERANECDEARRQFHAVEQARARDQDALRQRLDQLGAQLKAMQVKLAEPPAAAAPP